MKKKQFLMCSIILFFSQAFCYGQNQQVTDSLRADSLHQETEKFLLQQHQQQEKDSIIKSKLQKELTLASGDKQKRKELEEKLQSLVKRDSIRKVEQRQKISELKKNAKGFAVAPFTDTLFLVYARIGSFSPEERAAAVKDRILKLYEDPFFKADSLKINEAENSVDVLYTDERIIISVTDLDALWLGKEQKQIAIEYRNKINGAIAAEKKANSVNAWLKRLGLAALIILGLGVLIFIINWGFKKLTNFLYKTKTRYQEGLTIRKIKILSADQLLVIILRIKNILRIFVVLFSIYLSLPLLFNIFPETRDWTTKLINWVLNPVKSAVAGIFHFLPNLFTILVIYFIFRYAIKAVKYFVNEIEKGTIHLTGFHADWAQTTFSIVKFLLYAFMIILIFPYLPGSESPAFRGVSVFVGIIFSLGSSSAISNMVAGLVITYMRPFKIGDRIKIGDITGDVIEKSILVTRIRTIKNEDITIPNSTVLSGSTVNYSTCARPEDKGLILHTTVTIGYDVPWKKVHQALINAASRTAMILEEPKPFVLQTSLDDFYISYQINGYTKEANKQAVIYSDLHQHIQDCFNEAGIEILSPHYRQLRDGNMTTIPVDYLNSDYKAPAFNVKLTDGN